MPVQSSTDPLDVSALTVVVTGAAGGLGGEIAAKMSAHGASVVAVDLDEKAAQGIIDELPDRRSSYAVQVDLRSPEAVSAAFASIFERSGQVHGLVNCAGVREIGSILDISVAEWQNVISINLTGAFLCCREVAKHMTDALAEEPETFGRRFIINIASVAAALGIPARPAYTASKHGIVGLTKNLATDLGSRGVRVNAIAPGTIRTPLTDSYYADEEFLDGLRLMVPMGTRGVASDIGDAALFLASPMASFVNGAILTVDGGFASTKSYSAAGPDSPYLKPHSTV